MDFKIATTPNGLPTADAVVIPVAKGQKQLRGQSVELDQAAGGAVTRYLASEVFSAERGTAALVPLPSGCQAAWAVLAGIGDPGAVTRDSLARSAGAAIRKCAHAKAVSVLWLADELSLLPATDAAHAITLGSMLGDYSFTDFKTERAKQGHVGAVEYVFASNADTRAVQTSVNRAKVVAEAVILTRDLGNQPSNLCNPTCVAETAADICAKYGIACVVHERDWIESKGMGLIAAVSRGATQEPKFVQMNYTHPEASTTIALAGKGVTFDSGGYSLKTHEKMYGMKDDMHGAAAVIAAMRVAAQVKAKVNLIGLLPLTENMIGPNAVHPGDVFRSFAGKNVEIANTDAEGRLLLADTIAYAETLGVDAIIDLATLTGACVIALGKGMSAILGTDEELIDALRAAGNDSCEMLWPLPLHEEYMEHIKSDIADIKNTGGFQAGTIVGGLFIQSFVKHTPWAHIDLSGATIEKDTPLCPAGSTGAGAGTLAGYIMSFECSEQL